MIHRLKRPLLLLTAMLLMAALAGFHGYAQGLDTVSADVREKLSQISTKEQSTLEKLFAVSSEIELTNTQIQQLNKDIDGLRVHIRDKKAVIDMKTMSYGKIKNSMAGVLKARQRAGAASNMDIILNSKDLKDLIHRINLLRDLSKNTSALMERIQSARAALEKEQRDMDNMMGALQERQSGLKAARSSQDRAKLELEKQLEVLESDKAFYEASLSAIETQWKTLKPTFSNALRVFVQIIETGALPGDTVEVTNHLFYASGRIDQVKFNGILSKRRDLPEMKFGLHRDNATLEFPAYRLLLDGRFELVDEQTVRYMATGGTFYGLPLSKSALQDLFSEQKLVFSLKTIIGKNRIQRIDNHEGSMELIITGN